MGIEFAKAATAIAAPGADASSGKSARMLRGAAAAGPDDGVRHAGEDVDAANGRAVYALQDVNVSDEGTVRALPNAGNPDDETVRVLQAALSRYCRALTGSKREAEDLAQEAWEKALGYWRGAASANREAFLLRVARNAWIDRARRKAAYARARLLETAPAEAAPAPDGGSSGIELMFQALLQHLSPLQRAVFLLRDVFGFTAAEAAARLGATEGAVKAALHRARRLLPAVRRSLAEGADGLPLPKDEGLAVLLRALAAFYERGDVQAVVELARRDEAELPAVIGCVQSTPFRRRGAAAAPHGAGSPGLRLAA